MKGDSLPKVTTLSISRIGLIPIPIRFRIKRSLLSSVLHRPKLAHIVRPMCNTHYVSNYRMGQLSDWLHKWYRELRLCSTLSVIIAQFTQVGVFCYLRGRSGCVLGVLYQGIARWKQTVLGTRHGIPFPIQTKVMLSQYSGCWHYRNP